MAARCDPWNVSVRKSVRGSRPRSERFTRGNTNTAARQRDTALAPAVHPTRTRSTNRIDGADLGVGRDDQRRLIGRAPTTKDAAEWGHHIAESHEDDRRQPGDIDAFCTDVVRKPLVG